MILAYNFKNFMKDMNDKISKNLETKSKEFTGEIENIFNGKMTIGFWESFVE